MLAQYAFYNNNNKKRFYYTLFYRKEQIVLSYLIRTSTTEKSVMFP